MYNKGILWIATNDQYMHHAHQSCMSAKSVMPDVSTTIITDSPGTPNCFDNVIIRDLDGSFSDCPNFIGDTPYEYTLHVDADTYFVNSINDSWNLLDWFDVAVAHTPHRRYETVDARVPSYNTGVIFFRKSKVEDLFNDWQALYGTLNEERRPGKGLPDQPALRQALLKHASKYGELSYMTLPPEYNALVSSNVGFLRDEVKILHGEPAAMSFESVANLLDSTTSKRVYYPSLLTGRYKLRTIPSQNSIISILELIPGLTKDRLMKLRSILFRKFT